MSNLRPRDPKLLGDVLGELFALRGYARLRAAGDLQTVWDAALGDSARGRTRLGEVRRGVLTVIVDHPALLEELSVFRKAELLEAIRAAAGGSTINDLRFRIGAVDA